MAVQNACFSFFGITNYNDNNNIKPLMVKSPPRRFILDRTYRDSSSESCLPRIPLADSSVDNVISRYKLLSSSIEVVPSDLDSSDRSTFLVWSSYHTRMHREERRPGHRRVSWGSHHEL